MDDPGQRRYPRVASSAILELTHPAMGSWTLTARNASEGGFFVLRKPSTILPPVGTELGVVIRRFTGVLNDTPVKMRVVHINNEGMGLEILSL